MAEIRELEPAEVHRFRSLMPKETADYIGCELHFIGASDDSKPEGLLIYEKRKSRGTITSVYVAKGARRQGLGRRMMEVLGDLMQKQQIRFLTFSYVEGDDRASLTPFFDSVGAETVRVQIPSVTISLSEIAEAFGKISLPAAEGSAKKLLELDRNEKNIASEKIEQRLRCSSGKYFAEDSLSFTAFEGNDLKGMVLILPEADGDGLSIDYLFTENNAEMSLSYKLLSAGLAAAEKEYPKDTPIRAALVNESARQLFEKLFGRTAPDEAMVAGSYPGPSAVKKASE